MIRVNLLRDQTLRVRRTSIKPEVSRTGLVVVAAFLVLVGGLGTWYYSVRRQVQALETRRDDLRARSLALEQEKKQIAQYERLRKLRQQRISVIEKLKENQSGPVELLSHVIQAIPSDGLLWLTMLEQRGDRIQIRGYSARSEAIPDFLTSLSRSGFFKTVDLELVEAEPNAARFALVCTTARRTPVE